MECVFSARLSVTLSSVAAGRVLPSPPPEHPSRPPLLERTVSRFLTDNDTSGSLSAVNTPFTDETLKTEVGNCFMKGFVPYAAGLFHTVEAFHEAHYPVFLSRGFKTGWLFHVDCFGLSSTP